MISRLTRSPGSRPCPTRRQEGGRRLLGVEAWRRACERGRADRRTSRRTCARKLRVSARSQSASLALGEQDDALGPGVVDAEHLRVGGLVADLAAPGVRRTGAAVARGEEDRGDALAAVDVVEQRRRLEEEVVIGMGDSVCVREVSQLRFDKVCWRWSRRRTHRQSRCRDGQRRQLLVVHTELQGEGRTHPTQLKTAAWTVETAAEMRTAAENRVGRIMATAHGMA